jgi:hypothetical protein
VAAVKELVFCNALRELTFEVNTHEESNKITNRHRHLSKSGLFNRTTCSPSKAGATVPLMVH